MVVRCGNQKSLLFKEEEEKTFQNRKYQFITDYLSNLWALKSKEKSLSRFVFFIQNRNKENEKKISWLTLIDGNK